VVLEKLLSVKTAEKRPYLLFIFGIALSLTCLFISFVVFESSVGMFTTFLLTIALTPFMLNLLRYEEAREEELYQHRRDIPLIKRHRNILLVFSLIFVSIAFSYSLLYLILPESLNQKIFEDQINEINTIRGSFASPDTFLKIFSNNVGVLFLSFLFSFIFGAGAIFILAWNASVLAVAIGMLAKSMGGLKGFPLAVVVFFPHGSLEILAYFIGAIAGGLISAALTRRKPKWFYFILRDSIKLLAISVILLFIAGIVEVLAIALS